MPREHFHEQKSIKITKETWKRLRARSVDLERPMTALVEEAVVAYLAEAPDVRAASILTAPTLIPIRTCGWCHTVVPPEYDTGYCSVACQIAHSMEREGTPS